MIDPPASIDQIVRQARGLYSLPAVAMKVLELTAHDAVDGRALKQCIENDPALTGKLLRVVNSSLFGVSCEVTDLGQAIALLGTKPLKLLVLGFSLPDKLLSGIARDRLARYWRDALTKAVAAREIGETLWGDSADEAFVVGLLDDIGLLLLIQELKRPFLELLDDVDRTRDNLDEREIECLGFSHSTLSARLLDHWGLPQSVVGAVAARKSLGRLRGLPSDRASLVQILHMAGLLTELVAHHRLAVLPDLLEAGDVYCQMTRSQLSDLVRRVDAQVGQLADALVVDLPDGLEYHDVLVEAHARLADDVVATAVESARNGPLAAATGRCVTAAWDARIASVGGVSLPPSDGGGDRDATSAGGDSIRPDGAPTGLATLPRGWKASHPVLTGRVGVMITEARAHRYELSLLLAEMRAAIDRHGRSAETASDSLFNVLESACRHMDHPGTAILRLDSRRLAVVLPDCHRSRAVAMGNRLVDRVRRHAARSHGDPDRDALRLGVGVATVAAVSRNFLASTLIEGAERCLDAARAARGSSVKSIEVY